MRAIGTLPSAQQAQLFGDFLLTLNINAMAEQEDDAWTVWIVNEDDLDTAREKYVEFQNNPDDESYRKATQFAAGLRKAAAKEEERARKQVVNIRDKWRQPMAKRAPFTMFLIIASVGVGFFSGFGTTVDPLISKLGFAEFQTGPKQGGWYLPVVSRGDEQIREGQLWRLVTPAFIHLSVLHLVFNMYWTYQLGGMIESRRGTFRLYLMVLLMAAVSNYLQFSMKGPQFGGMSGVVYGLFGYIWMKGRHAPEMGMMLPQQTIMLMIGWLFLCMTGMMGPVANWAHGGGLVVGMVIGYAPIALRNLQRRR
jgi:GlpG protein